MTSLVKGLPNPKDLPFHRLCAALLIYDKAKEEGRTTLEMDARYRQLCEEYDRRVKENS